MNISGHYATLRHVVLFIGISPNHLQEFKLHRITYVSLLSVTLALGACGGGGADVPSQPAPSAPTPSPAPAPAQNPAPVATPAPAPNAVQSATITCGLPAFQQEMLKLVNQARASSRSCGDTFYAAVPAMTWNGKLLDAAVGHSSDMASKNYFAHVSLDGRTFDQRIGAAGYPWIAAGENIAGGQTGIEQVMREWLQSPGHCVNIMNGAFTEVGVSCVQNEASTYKRYWAMELGRQAQ
jgi:uncharacterized protein YkwD